MEVDEDNQTDSKDIVNQDNPDDEVIKSDEENVDILETDDKCLSPLNECEDNNLSDHENDSLITGDEDDSHVYAAAECEDNNLSDHVNESLITGDEDDSHVNDDAAAAELEREIWESDELQDEEFSNSYDEIGLSNINMKSDDDDDDDKELIVDTEQGMQKNIENTVIEGSNLYVEPIDKVGNDACEHVELKGQVEKVEESKIIYDSIASNDCSIHCDPADEQCIEDDIKDPSGEKCSEDEIQDDIKDPSGEQCSEDEIQDDIKDPSGKQCSEDEIQDDIKDPSGEQCSEDEIQDDIKDPSGEQCSEDEIQDDIKYPSGEQCSEDKIQVEFSSSCKFKEEENFIHEDSKPDASTFKFIAPISIPACSEAIPSSDKLIETETYSHHDKNLPYHADCIGVDINNIEKEQPITRDKNTREITASDSMSFNVDDTIHLEEKINQLQDFYSTEKEENKTDLQEKEIIVDCKIFKSDSHLDSCGLLKEKANCKDSEITQEVIFSTESIQNSKTCTELLNAEFDIHHARYNEPSAKDNSIICNDDDALADKDDFNAESKGNLPKNDEPTSETNSNTSDETTDINKCYHKDNVTDYVDQADKDDLNKCTAPESKHNLQKWDEQASGSNSNKYESADIDNVNKHDQRGYSIEYNDQADTDSLNKCEEPEGKDNLHRDEPSETVSNRYNEPTDIDNLKTSENINDACDKSVSESEACLSSQKEINSVDFKNTETENQTDCLLIKEDIPVKEDLEMCIIKSKGTDHCTENEYEQQTQDIIKDQRDDKIDNIAVSEILINNTDIEAICADRQINEGQINPNADEIETKNLNIDTEDKKTFINVGVYAQQINNEQSACSEINNDIAKGESLINTEKEASKMECSYSESSVMDSKNKDDASTAADISDANDQDDKFLDIIESNTVKEEFLTKINLSTQNEKNSLDLESKIEKRHSEFASLEANIKMHAEKCIIKSKEVRECENNEILADENVMMSENVETNMVAGELININTNKNDEMIMVVACEDNKLSNESNISKTKNIETAVTIEGLVTTDIKTDELSADDEKILKDEIHSSESSIISADKGYNLSPTSKISVAVNPENLITDSEHVVSKLKSEPSPQVLDSLNIESKTALEVEINPENFLSDNADSKVKDELSQQGSDNLSIESKIALEVEINPENFLSDNADSKVKDELRQQGSDNLSIESKIALEVEINPENFLSDNADSKVKDELSQQGSDNLSIESKIALEVEINPENFLSDNADSKVKDELSQQGSDNLSIESKIALEVEINPENFLSDNADSKVKDELSQQGSDNLSIESKIALEVEINPENFLSDNADSKVKYELSQQGSDNLSIESKIALEVEINPENFLSDNADSKVKDELSQQGSDNLSIESKIALEVEINPENFLSDNADSKVKDELSQQALDNLNIEKNKASHLASPQNEESKDSDTSGSDAKSSSYIDISNFLFNINKKDDNVDENLILSEDAENIEFHSYHHDDLEMADDLSENEESKHETPQSPESNCSEKSDDSNREKESVKNEMIIKEEKLKHDEESMKDTSQTSTPDRKDKEILRSSYIKINIKEINKDEEHSESKKEKKKQIIAITTDGLAKSSSKSSIFKEIPGEEIEGAAFSRIVIIGEYFCSAYHDVWPKDFKIKPYFLYKKKIMIESVYSPLVEHPFLKNSRKILVLLMLGAHDLAKYSTFKSLKCRSKHSRLKIVKELTHTSRMTFKCLSLMTNLKKKLDMDEAISSVFCYLPTINFLKGIVNVCSSSRQKCKSCICYYSINNDKGDSASNNALKLINRNIFYKNLNETIEGVFEFLPSDIQYHNDEWMFSNSRDSVNAKLLGFQLNEYLFGKRTDDRGVEISSINLELTLIRKKLLGARSTKILVIGDTWMKCVAEDWSIVHEIQPLFYCKDNLKLNDIKNLILSITCDEELLVITAVPSGEIFSISPFSKCTDHTSLQYPVPEKDLIEDPLKYAEYLSKKLDLFVLNLRESRKNCRVVFLTCYPVYFKPSYKYFFETHTASHPEHVSVQTLNDVCDTSDFDTKIEKFFKKLNKHILTLNKENGLLTCNIFSLVSKLASLDMFVFPIYIQRKCPPISVLGKLLELFHRYIYSLADMVTNKFPVEVDTKIKKENSKSSAKEIVIIDFVQEQKVNIKQEPVDSVQEFKSIEKQTDKQADSHQKKVPVKVPYNDKVAKKQADVESKSDTTIDSFDEDEDRHSTSRETKEEKSHRKSREKVREIKEEKSHRKEDAYKKASSGIKEKNSTSSRNNKYPDMKIKDDSQHLYNNYRLNYSSREDTYDRGKTPPYRPYSPLRLSPYSYRNVVPRYSRSRSRDRRRRSRSRSKHQQRRSGSRHGRRSRSRSSSRHGRRNRRSRERRRSRSLKSNRRRQKRSRSRSRSESNSKAKSSSHSSRSDWHKCTSKKRARSPTPSDPPSRRTALSTEEDALADLWSIHDKECNMYRNNPGIHPDHDRVKRKWVDVMNSQGLNTNDTVILAHWSEYWRKKMEEIFKESWEEKKVACLSVLSTKIQHKKISGSRSKSLTRSGSSSEDSGSPDRKRKHKKRSKKKSKTESKPKIKSKSSKNAESEINDDQVEDLENRLKEYMKKVTESHAASPNAEPPAAATLLNKHLYKPIPKAISVKESHKLLEITGILCQISERFGALGMSLTVLHEKALECSQKGANPFDFIDEDTKMLLDLIVDKIKKILVESELTFIQRAIIQEAHDRLVPFLEAYEKKKGSPFGVDIDSLAKATLGLQVAEIIGLIRADVTHRGYVTISNEDLMSIYLEIKSHQVKLVNRKEAEIENSSMAQSSRREVPRSSLNQAPTRAARIRNEFLSLSQHDKVDKFARFHTLPFEEKSFLLSYLDEMEKTDKNLTNSLRLIILRSKPS